MEGSAAAKHSVASRVAYYELLVAVRFSDNAFGLMIMPCATADLLAAFLSDELTRRCAALEGLPDEPELSMLRRCRLLVPEMPHITPGSLNALGPPAQIGHIPGVRGPGLPGANPPHGALCPARLESPPPPPPPPRTASPHCH